MAYLYIRRIKNYNSPIFILKISDNDIIFIQNSLIINKTSSYGENYR